MPQPSQHQPASHPAHPTAIVTCRHPLDYLVMHRSGVRFGHELVAAGLLLLAGPVDGDQLLDAVRTGYERGKGSLQGYDPSG